MKIAFYEGKCTCGKTWRGRTPVPEFDCGVCYPVDEVALEQFEHDRRERLALANEY